MPVLHTHRGFRHWFTCSKTLDNYDKHVPLHYMSNRLSNLKRITGLSVQAAHLLHITLRYVWSREANHKEKGNRKHAIST